MRVIGDDIGAIRRRSVAILPALLIAFLVAFYLLVAAGQVRLEAANERVRTSQQLHRALGDYVALLARAEAARRAYLLTGSPANRGEYAHAAGAFGPALGRIHAAYLAGASGPDRTAELRRLTAAELDELDAGPAPGAAGAERARGRRASILGIVNAMRREETRGMLAASARWKSDLDRSRWFTAVGAALNMGLLIFAIRQVKVDLRRRARMAASLREREAELERLVDERTRELAALSTHLQDISEQEKSALARELHDELGGLLVGARMDLSWLRIRLGAQPPAVVQRFERIQQSLAAGVNLKRRVIEGLRPTLLDNMGLFAALRWQLRESCARNGLAHEEHLPPGEPAFDPAAAIAVFRVVQEALTNVLKHAGASRVSLSVDVDGTTFSLRIVDDGRGIAPGPRPHGAGHGLASMRQRVAALGGDWDAWPGVAGGTTISARIPLERMLATARGPEVLDLQCAAGAPHARSRSTSGRRS